MCVCGGSGARGTGVTRWWCAAAGPCVCVLWGAAMLEGENQKGTTEYIEECMARREPMYSVLRLMTIQCIAEGGFKSKQLESYKRDFLQACARVCVRGDRGGRGHSAGAAAWRRQAYGYEHLATLSNLERVKLLRTKKGDSTWPALTKCADRDAAIRCGVAPLTCCLCVCVWVGGAVACRHFRLIFGDVNTTEPNDIAYVTAGCVHARRRRPG